MLAESFSPGATLRAVWSRFGASDATGGNRHWFQRRPRPTVQFPNERGELASDILPNDVPLGPQPLAELFGDVVM